ncbi:hypothetical protein G9A89_018102 [Geosiphon pyriformis]|nr:hypothetical protein G9A89_018102 [Geosiphon pyriformis]
MVHRTKKKTQGSGKVVTKYAKVIRKLIKRVDSGRNWTEEQKIHFFTKGLKTDLFYALWPFLALKNNSTMDMVIELAQQIEDNQRMHLEFILLIFVLALVMAPALQMAAISFAVQIQDSNKQLIDRLTANFQPLYQRQQNHGPLVCYCCELTRHFSRDCNNSFLPLPALRNNNNQNNRTINNNVSNQKPNHANINFFGKNSLVEATAHFQRVRMQANQKNSFYVFNLIDNDYNIDELAINTSELTRKKKKTKIDFIIDPKKASTSTANNKNSSKLELPKIVQKSGFYSVVKDLMKTPAHIIFGQLMTHLQFRKDLCKSLIFKKKTLKTNKCLCQAGLTNNNNVTPFICKAQVAGYFINLILNSKSSVSIIAKHFLEAIGKKIDELSTRPMTNIHSDKKKSLDIAKAVSVQINDISIEINIEVFEAKKYIIIVGNKWLKKAKVLLDYKLCELTIRCDKKPIVIKCHHWTTPPV